MTLRCLIVDDSPRFTATARRVLERQGLAVVGVAATGAEAFRLVRALRPRVVLVDLDLGAESGFAVARLLHTRQPPPVLVLISVHAREDYADLIAASPAAGFLAKAELTAAAIRALVTGPPGT